jgi:hypothetical protein
MNEKGFITLLPSILQIRFGANTLAYCARAWVMQQKRFYDIEPLIIIPLTFNNRTLCFIDESDE